MAPITDLFSSLSIEMKIQSIYNWELCFTQKTRLSRPILRSTWPCSRLGAPWTWTPWRTLWTLLLSRPVSTRSSCWICALVVVIVILESCSPDCTPRRARARAVGAPRARAHAVGGPRAARAPRVARARGRQGSCPTTVAHFALQSRYCVTAFRKLSHDGRSNRVTSGRENETVMR